MQNSNTRKTASTKTKCSCLKILPLKESLENAFLPALYQLAFKKHVLKFPYNFSVWKLKEKRSCWENVLDFTEPQISGKQFEILGQSESSDSVFIPLLSTANFLSKFIHCFWKKKKNWQPGATSDVQPIQKFLSSTFLGISVSFLALKEHSSNVTYYLSVTFHQRAQRWRSPAYFLKISQNVLSRTQTYVSKKKNFFFKVRRKKKLKLFWFWQ